MFLHLGILEDYTAAAPDLESALNNPNFEPVGQPFVWRYDVPNRTPVSTRSTFTSKLPLPPRELSAADERGRDLGGARRRQCDGRDARGGDRRDASNFVARGRGERSHDGGRDDHRRGHNGGRDTLARRAQPRGPFPVRAAQRQRTSLASGPTQRIRLLERKSFQWPRRHDDDNDDGHDDYQHPGRGRGFLNNLYDCPATTSSGGSAHAPQGAGRANSGDQRTATERDAPTFMPPQEGLVLFPSSLPNVDELQNMAPLQLQTLSLFRVRNGPPITGWVLF